MLLNIFRPISLVFIEKLFKQERDHLGRANFVGMQSPKLVHLLGWLQGQDTFQNNYLLAHDTTEIFENISKEGNYFRHPRSNKLFRIVVMFPGDLKSTQVNSGCGGSSTFVPNFDSFTTATVWGKGFPSIQICKNCQREKELVGNLDIPCYCEMKMNLRECEVIRKAGFTFCTYPRSNNKITWKMVLSEMKIRETCIPKVAKGCKYTAYGQYMRDITESRGLIHTLKEKEIDMALRNLNACSAEVYNMFLDTNTLLSLESLEEAFIKFANTGIEIQKDTVLTLPNPVDGPGRVKKINTADVNPLSISDNCRMEKKKALLAYYMYESGRARYVGQLDGKHTIKDIGNAYVCVLHCEMRIGEWLLTRMYQESQSYGTLQDKKKRLNESNIILQNCLSGQIMMIPGEIEDTDLGDGISIDVIEESNDSDETNSSSVTSFGLKKEKDIVQPVKVSCVRLRKIMKISETIIASAFSNHPEAAEVIAKYTKLIQLYIQLTIAFKQTELFTTEEMSAFRTTCRKFYQTFIDTFGRSRITNYVFIVGSCTLYETLLECGTLAHLSGISLEGYVRVLKTSVLSKSADNGGYGTKAEAVLRTTKCIADLSCRRSHDNISAMAKVSKGADMSIFDEINYRAGLNHNNNLDNAKLPDGRNERIVKRARDQKLQEGKTIRPYKKRLSDEEFKASRKGIARKNTMIYDVRCMETEIEIATV